MLRRLRHALFAFAISLGFVSLAAEPAHAVCNDVPSQCARVVHSVLSDVSRISVSRVYPAQSGYLEALSRGAGGTYAGVYIPVCYQALVTLPSGYQFLWIRGWHGLYSGNVSYLVIVEWVGGTGC